MVGILVVLNPSGTLKLIAIAGGLWLSYLGVAELLTVLRSAANHHQQQPTVGQTVHRFSRYGRVRV